MACQSPQENSENQSYEVKLKSFQRSVNETGEIASEVERKINAPFSTKINDLIEEGTFVKKDEKISSLAVAIETDKRDKVDLEHQEATFDLKVSQLEGKRKVFELQKQMENTQLELQIERLKLRKMLEERDRLKVTQSQQKLKSLEKEIGLKELEVLERERLFAKGYLAEIDVQKTRTKLATLLKQKEATKAQLKVDKGGATKETIGRQKIKIQQVETKLSKARTEKQISQKIARLNVQEGQVSIDNKKKTYNYYNDLVKKGTVKSPVDGMVVYGKMRVGNERVKIKAGDTIREGVTIVNIIDLNLPLVKLYVNEVDVGQIKVGMPARLALDAYPNLYYKGQLHYIAAIAENLEDNDKNEVKVFETHIKILDGNDKLKPGMTANVEIVTHEQKNIIAIPSQAILEENKKYYCFVKSLGSFRKQAIITADSNELETIVTKGLQPGDIVALNPGKYLK